ncbi:hypothetical protein KTAU_02170 [Thermogemmatispora aurantia]|jgi:hypothetical protein|uniref:Uncharacterized protein n=1 Tax=Thermogemmatispora aurantia TaxID=2045279 RepID=A0A5J4K4H3_9CHLR|nr:hypothetical protein KTAU_02170 [Thermogemmatispora aurantia]
MALVSYDEQTDDWRFGAAEAEPQKDGDASHSNHPLLSDGRKDGWVLLV